MSRRHRRSGFVSLDRWRLDGGEHLDKGGWWEIAETTVSPLMAGAVGGGVANDTAAWLAVLEWARKTPIKNGVIDGGGKTYAVAPNTLVLDDELADVIIARCRLVPYVAAGSEWPEEGDNPTRAYWRRYQTYGPSFVVKKPLIEIHAGNPNLALVDVSLDCKYLSAGIRVSGGATGRRLENVSIENVRTYGLYVQEQCAIDLIGNNKIKGGQGGNTFTANTTSGQQNLTNVSSAASLCVGQKLVGDGIPAGAYIDAIPNATTVKLSVAATETAENVEITRLRDVYGAAFDGNDCHWRGLTAQYCHCPLLTSGGSFTLTACDLFNGATEMGIVDPRLWEHRGGSTHWLGGRLGKGVIHIWNTDLAIYPTKLATGRDPEEVDYTMAYIVLHATSANDKLGTFQIYPSELSDELLNGTVKLFAFAPAAGLAFTANTTVNQKLLTNVTMPGGLSAAELAIDQPLAGVNIDSDARIAEIDSIAKTVRMTKEATGSGAGVTVTPAGTWQESLTDNIGAPHECQHPFTAPYALWLIRGNSAEPAPDVIAHFMHGASANAMLRFLSSSAKKPEIGLRADKLSLGFHDAPDIVTVAADGSVKVNNLPVGPRQGSASYNPPSIAAGAEVSTNVTVTGAALGDFALASFSLDLGGLKIAAAVTAANAVTVWLRNDTAGPIDLGSGTLRARVFPQ